MSWSGLLPEKPLCGWLWEQLLRALGIELAGYVACVGSAADDDLQPTSVKEIQTEIAKNDMRVVDQDKVEAIHRLIDQTKEAGDTLGGQIRVVVNGVPVALGSYVSWDIKLDAKLAAPAVGVNAMKGVSFGDGFELGQKPARTLDMGNSGTTTRLLMGLLPGTDFDVRFAGDASLQKRPMRRVADPLRAFGARVELSPTGTLPCMIHGQKLHRAEVQLQVASAQVKSALIFAALRTA